MAYGLRPMACSLWPVATTAPEPAKRCLGPQSLWPLALARAAKQWLAHTVYHLWPLLGHTVQRLQPLLVPLEPSPAQAQRALVPRPAQAQRAFLPRHARHGKGPALAS